VEDNLKAVEVFGKLTPEILKKIEDILDNKPSRGLNFRNWIPLKPRR